MFKKISLLCMVTVFYLVLGCGDDSQSSRLTQIGRFPPQINTNHPPIPPRPTSQDLDTFIDQSIPLSSAQASQFPFNNIGVLGNCAVTLLSEQIAITAAHCLVDKFGRFRPEARRVQFVQNGITYSIPVSMVVLRTSKIPTDINSIQRSKDWAFLILERNRVTYEIGRFLQLSQRKVQYPMRVDAIGLDDQGKKIYSKIIGVQQRGPFLDTSYAGSSAENSGVLIYAQSQVVALFIGSTDTRLERPQLRLPTAPNSRFTPRQDHSETRSINVAISVDDSMIKTFNAISSSLDSPFSTTLYTALENTDYLDNSYDEIIVLDLKKNIDRIEQQRPTRLDPRVDPRTNPRADPRADPRVDPRLPPPPPPPSSQPDYKDSLRELPHVLLDNLLDRILSNPKDN